MATETVSLEELRKTLKELDRSTQNLNTDIEAMCAAARLVLESGGRGAAKTAYTLLGLISTAVLSHENYVNAEAETHGCHWIDEIERSTLSALAKAEVSHA